MNPQVLRPDEAKEYYTDERCYILEMSNSPADETLSIARARVESGVTTAWHRVSDTAERYVILEGEGYVEIEGLSETHVGRGDVVLIPPGAQQRIRNQGKGDLVFLALCTPRFEFANYEDTESLSR